MMRRLTRSKQHLDSWDAMLSLVREEAEKRGHLLLGYLIGVAILEVQLIREPEPKEEEKRSGQSIDESSVG
jgi:hypothetical protein